MTTVNIFEAKSSLSRLIHEVESGAQPEIIIARNGRPAARLVPIPAGSADRRIGVAEGRFEVPDDLDLDNPEVAELFGAGSPDAGD